MRHGLHDLLLDVRFGLRQLTLAMVAVGVTVAACAACWLPALKAARVDPAIVLRQE